jgi:hypothetical protein
MEAHISSYIYIYIYMYYIYIYIIPHVYIYIYIYIYGRLRLGPSTTLVLDSGSRVRDYKCIRSSIWETLAKSGRLTHPQVTNHSLNFSNFSPTAHVGTVFPAAVFQILSSTLAEIS